MSTWNMFQFAEPRQKREQPYSENQRALLEFSVGLGVAKLLGSYGRLELVELVVNVHVNAKFDYHTLGIWPHDLADGSTIFVHQQPRRGDQLAIMTGLHAVELESPAGEVAFGLTVPDPKFNGVRRPYTYDLEWPSLAELAEVNDALDLLMALKTLEAPAITPPYPTNQYPERCSDSDFAALIAGI